MTDDTRLLQCVERQRESGERLERVGASAAFIASVLEAQENLITGLREGVAAASSASSRLLTALSSGVTLEALYDLLEGCWLARARELQDVVVRHRDGSDVDLHIKLLTRGFGGWLRSTITGTYWSGSLAALMNSSERSTAQKLVAALHYPVGLQWLVATKPKFDARDGNGDGPLINAAFAGEVELLQTILAFGSKVRVNSVDTAGRSALWRACNRKRTACVRALLRAGANPNQAAPDGRVPLMLKINLEIARMLLDAGASPDHRDKDGMSVLDRQSFRPELCMLIREFAR